MISQRNSGNVVILDLPGVIETDKLQGEVRGLLSANQKKIAMNLEKISFVESSGLGALVAAYKLVNEEGGNMVFFNMQPYVQKLVEVTRLNKVLNILPDEQQATEALA